MLWLQCWCLLQAEVQAAGVTARAEKALKLVLCGDLSPFEDAFQLPQFRQERLPIVLHGPVLRPKLSRWC
jgi:hypothetical protein